MTQIQKIAAKLAKLENQCREARAKLDASPMNGQWFRLHQEWKALEQRVLAARVELNIEKNR